LSAVTRFRSIEPDKAIHGPVRLDGVAVEDADVGRFDGPGDRGGRERHSNQGRTKSKWLSSESHHKSVTGPAGKLIAALNLFPSRTTYARGKSWDELSRSGRSESGNDATLRTASDGPGKENAMANLINLSEFDKSLTAARETLEKTGKRVWQLKIDVMNRPVGEIELTEILKDLWLETAHLAQLAHNNRDGRG
jgi:hypothetical protein